MQKPSRLVIEETASNLSVPNQRNWVILWLPSRPVNDDVPAVSYSKISPRAPKDSSCAHPPLPVSSCHTLRYSWKKFSLFWKYCTDVSEEPAAPVVRVDRNFHTDCFQSFKSLMMISYRLINVVMQFCDLHDILFDSNMVIFHECVNVLSIFAVE